MTERVKESLSWYGTDSPGTRPTRQEAKKVHDGQGPRRAVPAVSRPSSNSMYWSRPTPSPWAAT